MMRLATWAVMMLLAAAGPVASQAATRVWTGTAANGSVSDPGNWGGTAPEAADRLLIAVTVPTEVRVESRNSTFAGIDFAGPVTVSGAALTLTSDHPVTVNVAASAAGTAAFAADVRFSSLNAVLEIRSVTGGATVLRFVPATRLTVAGGDLQLWAMGTTSSYELLADIREESRANLFLRSEDNRAFSGQTRFRLSGNNNVSGTVTSFAYEIQVDRPESIGTPLAALSIQAGRLTLGGGAPGSTFTYPQSLVMRANAQNLQLRVTGNVAFSGPVSVEGGIPWIFEGDATLDGPLLNVGAVSIQSRATTTIRGDLSGFSGTITVSSGLVRVLSRLTSPNSQLWVFTAGILDIGEAGHEVRTFDCGGTVRVAVGSGYVRASADSRVRSTCTVEPSLASRYAPPAGGAIGVLDMPRGAGAPPGSVIPELSGLPEGRVVAVGGVPMRVSYVATTSRVTLAFLPFTPAAIAGSGQTVAIGASTAQAFTVRVTNATGTPLPNAVVVFASTCGTFGGAASAEATTDAGGLASSPLFVAGSTVGTCAVTASIRGAPATSGATLAVQVYDPAFNVQDMWWAGATENGWGMSIAQHADTLFGVIYAYDAAGNPVWYVMPGGSWNARHDAYSGLLYKPRGSPFHAYDASRFAVGAAVGAITLAFTDTGHATLDYRIDGVSVRKSLVRQAFGPPAAGVIANRGDLWWGGQSQNGWGVAVLQQNATLFSVWFTYGDDGTPTWFVMPGGQWSAPDTYEGRLYRAAGPAWLGVAYDPARFHVTDVGPYRLRFGGEGATLDWAVDGRSGTLSLARQPF